MKTDLKKESDRFQQVLQNEINKTRITLEETDKRIEELSILLQDKEMQTDRSENASFQIARDERDAKSAIKHLLEEKLSTLTTESDNYAPTGTIQLGSTVQLQLLSVDGKRPIFDKTNFIIKLVSHAIANAELGLVAFDYKVGFKLLGHKEGDTIEVQATKGSLVYQIEGVY